MSGVQTIQGVTGGVQTIKGVAGGVPRSRGFAGGVQTIKGVAHGMLTIKGVAGGVQRNQGVTGGVHTIKGVAGALKVIKGIATNAPQGFTSQRAARVYQFWKKNGIVIFSQQPCELQTTPFVEHVYGHKSVISVFGNPSNQLKGCLIRGKLRVKRAEIDSENSGDFIFSQIDNIQKIESLKT